jgi:hypothetical protein
MSADADAECTEGGAPRFWRLPREEAAWVLERVRLGMALCCWVLRDRHISWIGIVCVLALKEEDTRNVREKCVCVCVCWVGLSCVGLEWWCVCRFGAGEWEWAEGMCAKGN